MRPPRTQHTTLLKHRAQWSLRGPVVPSWRCRRFWRVQHPALVTACRASNPDPSTWPLNVRTNVAARKRPPGSKPAALSDELPGAPVPLIRGETYNTMHCSAVSVPQRCLGSSPCSSSNFATCDNGQEACDSGQEDNGKRARGHWFSPKMHGRSVRGSRCRLSDHGAYARARQGTNTVTNPSEKIVTNPAHYGGHLGQED